MKVFGNQYIVDTKAKARRGGMAEILRAVDKDNNFEPVAIKLFREDLDTSKHYLASYVKESESLQRLSHPHIVRLLGGGTSPDGRKFLVLEWLETPLIDHLLESPPLGWDSFYSDIGRPILDALTYAFSLRIYHRDLKPQNVLFSADGVLKLADFGISKLECMIAPGITVSGFRSKPYAPPEADDGLHVKTRDVYGFAALSLACLSRDQFSEYEDLYKALTDFDGPVEIAAVLERALSRDPTLRPASIVELASEIEGIQKLRESRFATPAQEVCYVRIAPRVERKISELYGIDPEAAKKRILEEINGTCGVGFNKKMQKKEAVQLSLYASQQLFVAEVDPMSKSFLIIHQVFEFQPSWLEYQRELAWTPSLRFVSFVGPMPPHSKLDAISILLESIKESEDQKAEEIQAAQGDQVFKTWTSILYAKSAVEEKREAPIQYQGFEKNGNRLTLYVSSQPTFEVVGQPRLIEVKPNVSICGEIEAVGADNVILWVDDFPSEPIPNSGRIQFDTRAGRQAIARQRQALDSVRFRRCVRPDLKDYLIWPERASSPSEIGEISFAQTDLDDSKKAAVAKALGTDSFLVVEGPPGTGKTKFITEVVIQTLRRSPEARILLTSQTHVALDNALEKIRTLDPSVKLTRIGRRDDSRVSPSVSDLLLENRVDKWLSRVQSNSQKFLKQFAGSHEVDAASITLGIGIARYRAAVEELSALEKKKSESAQEVTSLNAKDEERASNDLSDTFDELREAIRQSSETDRRLELEIKRIRGKVKDAKVSLAGLKGGADLADLSAQELAMHEESLIGKDLKTRQIHKVFQLAEEWYLRFGRSRDFFAALIADSDVIAGTCLGFSSVKGMHNIEFDLCIVDEASKATVNELLVPLSRSQKWILVGDRQQLPPFVEDALEDTDILETYNLSKEDFKLSVLDILTDRLPIDCVSRLIHQHRMTRQIGDLISQCFYDRSLLSEREIKSSHFSPILSRPVTWLTTSGHKDKNERWEGQSYKNLLEVSIVRGVLRRINLLAKSRKGRISVAVLTAYNSQKVELLRGVDFDHQDLDWLDLECNTVDAFQGREAEIAIYSVTRSNPNGKIGFLRELKRLNVALSRGRNALVIVGDATFLRSAGGFNPWDRVIDYIEAHAKDCAMEEAVL